MKLWSIAALSLAVHLGCRAPSTPPGPGSSQPTPTRSPGATPAPEHAPQADGTRGPAPATLPPAPPSKPPSLQEAEIASYKAAKPVFEEHCGHCHTGPATSRAERKTLAHFRMDEYPFQGHHQHELAAAIRRVLGASGRPATMPKDDPGAVTGEELRLIMAWASAHDAAHKTDAKKKAHRHRHKH